MAEELVTLTPNLETRLLRMLKAFEAGQFDLDAPGQIRGRRNYGVLLGKSSSEVVQGATGTFTVWSGETKGSETALTDVTVSAYARSMAVPANAMAYLQPVGSTGWEAVPVECP